MIRKNINTVIGKIVKKYFSGHYTASCSVFTDLKSAIEGVDIDEKTMSHLQRLLQIFFLGQVLDLHTLNSIFVHFGITNGHQKVNYKNIRKSLTNNKLHQIFDYVFEQQLASVLRSLAQKDSCTFSRTLVTVVLDDSVFKQWLTMQLETLSAEDAQFYGSFFSGQIGRTAWGYQVVSVGVNVGEIFYPLYFQCVRKPAATPKEQAEKIATLTTNLTAKRTEKKALLAEISEKNNNMKTEEDKEAMKSLKLAFKTQEEAVRVAKKALSEAKNVKKVVEKKEVALKLIEKTGKFIEKVNKQGAELPSLVFSCDSGYADIGLSAACEKYGMRYISVPAKSHKFTFDEEKMTLKTWLETTFIAAENKHNAAESALPAAEKTPFVYRQRAFYHAQDRDVTILAFRLKNSKKITVIYSPDKNIKAKTLRRHWFARTQIEQFFKLLKHYMKIQQSITTNKHDFEFKLLCFAFVALHLQHLIQYIRRHCPEFKRKGLGTLRFHIHGNTDIFDTLKMTFCTQQAA